MRAPSFDRLTFLWLHRLGMMGRAEYRLLHSLVKPGMQILDVGANIGLYTLLLARMAGPTGHVFAFEPEPSLFACLQTNREINGSSNVTAFNLAAGASPEALFLRRSTLNSGNNSLVTSGVATTVPVKVARIDQVLDQKKIDLIKIDVQGFELKALAGMEGILTLNPGAQVLFEFWPAGLARMGDSGPRLLAFFRERHFKLFEVEDEYHRELTGYPKLTGDNFINILATPHSLPRHAN